MGKQGCRFSPGFQSAHLVPLLAASRKLCVFVLLADACSLGGIWAVAAGPARAVSLEKYETEKPASAVGSRRVEVA